MSRLRSRPRLRVPEPDDRLVAAMEKAWGRLVGDARERVDSLLAQQVVTLVADAGQASVARPDALFDVDEWMAAARAELTPLIVEGIATAAGVVGVAFDVTDPRMVAAVERHVAAVESWGEGLREKVARTVERGMADGWSVDRMAEEINADGVLTDKQAVNIARTQATAAANAGTLAAWSEFGVVARKVWLATGDDRTRESHMEADGQEVPIDGMFEVGGYSAEYPGDPSLPPSESSSCRCSMLAVEGEPPPPPTAELPDPSAMTVPLSTARGRVPLTRHRLEAAVTDTQPAEAETADEPGATSAMVALGLASPISAADGLPGALAAEDQHLTLVYLGKVDDLTDEALAVAAGAAAAGAAATGGPIEASIAGAGVLGDEGAVVLFVQHEEIVVVQGAVADALGDYGWESYHEQHPNFIPHVTLGYGSTDEETSALLAAATGLVGQTVSFDRVDLHVAGDVTGVPLGTPAEAEPDDSEPPVEMTATFSLTVEEAVEGAGVAWTEDGVERTGVVVELVGADPETGEPTAAVVAPDDAPDDRVEVALADLSTFAGAAPDDDVEVEVEVEQPALGVGTSVEWDEGDMIRTGVITEIGDDSVIVSPDDDPEISVQLPVDAVRVITGPEAGEAATMRWTGLLVPEGVESGDGRVINPQVLGWREVPLTLMAMFRNPDGGAGHAAAVVAGRIDNIWRHADRPTELWGDGVYANTRDGRMAYAYLKNGMVRGVSVDLCDVKVEWEQLAEDDDPLGDEGRMFVVAGKIMGATQCAFPAFAEAYLEVVAADALVASSADHVEMRAWTLLDAVGGIVASAGRAIGAYPDEPPAAWFDYEDHGGLFPVRVSPDGRIFGYVADWTSCHIGMGPRCVTAPRSQCAYGEYRKGQTLTAEGTLVPTGPIIVDTVHPDLALQASDAQAFYAHTGCVVGDVAVHEDHRGIYIAGACRPSATADMVRALRGGDVSPDWRPFSRWRTPECVAMLVVNNSGFKVPDTLVASAGGQVVLPGNVRALLDLASDDVIAMVGAGRIRRSDHDAAIDRLTARVDELYGLLAPIRRERAMAIADRIKASRQA